MLVFMSVSLPHRSRKQIDTVRMSNLPFVALVNSSRSPVIILELFVPERMSAWRVQFSRGAYSSKFLAAVRVSPYAKFDFADVFL